MKMEDSSLGNLSQQKDALILTAGSSKKTPQPDYFRVKPTTQQGLSTHSEFLSNLFWCLKYEYTANNNTEYEKNLRYKGH